MLENPFILERYNRLKAFKPEVNPKLTIRKANNSRSCWKSNGLSDQRELIQILIQ